MSERYTILEWMRRFPTTEDKEELQRRTILHGEREEQLDLVEPGRNCYLIRNRKLGIIHFRTTDKIETALRDLNWPPHDCRWICIEVGKEKQTMPDEVKEILKAKNEEKKRERNDGKPEKGPSLKSEMESVFQQNPDGDKDLLVPMILEILKRRNPDKDEAHLKKRAVLCYHFYKKGSSSENT